MKPTGVSRPFKTWSAIRVFGPWEVYTLLLCSCHMRSLGSLCVLAILAQLSMNPHVYPTGFVRCPFECSVDPCRRRTGFGTPYGQSCRTVWGKYRACRTHTYGRLSDHARLSTSQKSSEANLRKLYMLIFQQRLYGPVRVQKPAKNRTKPQLGHPSSLIRVFAMRLIGKQGYKT